jgi:transposase
MGSYSHQSQAGQGYGLEAFELDWDAEQARCPQGHVSITWRSRQHGSGDPVIRIRFARATCRACEARALCTRSQDAPRALTVLPQAQPVALQAARQRQETDEFKAQYALRAGVESSISQGVRRFDLRRSRYIGLARTHLQQTITATAMNLVRLADWFRKGKVEQLKRRPGHFARLAPHRLSSGWRLASRAPPPARSSGRGLTTSDHPATVGLNEPFGLTWEPMKTSWWVFGTAEIG